MVHSEVLARPYCALMGDLVSSEEAPSYEDLHSRFNHAIELQNQRGCDALVSPLTVTLGDEFQGLGRTFVDGLSIMRSMRLHLLRNSVDCRFALGLVRIETPVNVERAWNMMGPGLARTRKKLNDKGNETRYRFAFADHPHIEAVLDALGAGLTAIERSWTSRQLGDISALLEGATVQKIAQLRNVSAHSVYKVRSSGNFELYVLQWSAISEALAHLDELYGLT